MLETRRNVVSPGHVKLGDYGYPSGYATQMDRAEAQKVNLEDTDLEISSRG